jgi:hypothetical protein
MCAGPNDSGFPTGDPQRLIAARPAPATRHLKFPYRFYDFSEKHSFERGCKAPGRDFRALENKGAPAGGVGTFVGSRAVAGISPVLSTAGGGCVFRRGRDVDQISLDRPQLLDRALRELLRQDPADRHIDRLKPLVSTASAALTRVSAGTFGLHRDEDLERLQRKRARHQLHITCCRHCYVALRTARAARAARLETHRGCMLWQGREGTRLRCRFEA